MKSIGFVGWRGMVGSVLIDRMHQEKDFSKFKAYAFTTSNIGGESPSFASNDQLLDAFDFKSLLDMDIIVTCQGSNYTEEVHSKLREKSWNGYWIDAASSLRVNDKATIVLDPLNQKLIEENISKGCKDLIGGNCTVSLLLLSIKGLLEIDAIDWISSMTYQAASGGGARHMMELLKQMNSIGSFAANNEDLSILDLEKKVHQLCNEDSYPNELFSPSLALNNLPWIDSLMDNGQTREEWKAQVEANKILDRDSLIIDGTCVRVGALRSHAQALTIKLKKDISLDEINSILKEQHPWISFAENNKEDTLNKLTPTNISGSLNIGVGRVRKMNMGSQYLNLYTIGDQLLWGAAEPLRRAINIVLS